MLTPSQIQGHLGDYELSSRPGPRRGWYRSAAKGNLTRVMGSLRLTVFERWGGYSFSIAEGADVIYSRRLYRSERAAMIAVMEVVTE